MNHRVVVGMEVHLQLRTKSKMFCRCPVRFGAPPNTLVCPVCLGMPGSLPVPNRDAMILALSAATAMGCTLADETKFDRKNYFYPDLPKGYQISQYDRPLATGGAVEIVAESGVKRVRLRRLHIEEDVGKSLHDDEAGVSRVDFNRAGTPLVEIVSEPDIASPEEARAYLQALRALVQYLGISDGNMQEGNLRCEPNVNLHIDADGRRYETPIVEVKNVNSVRNVERAVRSEVARHLAEFQAKGPAFCEEPRSTRGFDDARDATFVMRGKEAAHDYRYFPEPDIPPIRIGSAWRAEALARVPELPDSRRRRFVAQYGLNDYDAEGICRERETAEYFESVVKAGAAPKPAANWILTELAREANERKATIAGLGVSAPRLAALVGLVESGRVARAAALKELLPRLLRGDADPAALVAELGLAMIEDDALLREAAREAVARNPKAAEDVRSGKEKAYGPLMGAVMRKMQGKANPDSVRRVLKAILEDR